MRSHSHSRHTAPSQKAGVPEAGTLPPVHCASQSARVLHGSGACNSTMLGPVVRLFAPGEPPAPLERALASVPADVLGTGDASAGVFAHAATLHTACRTTLAHAAPALAQAREWDRTTADDRLVLAALAFDYGAAARATRNPLAVLNAALCERHAMPLWLCRDVLHHAAAALAPAQHRFRWSCCW